MPSSKPGCKTLSFLLTCTLFAATSAFAQVTAPSAAEAPLNYAGPKPFEYPEEIGAGKFTLEHNPARIIHFGDYALVLGVTRLSEAARTLGGELRHLPDRTEFLCYSAPLSATRDKRELAKISGSEPAEEPPEPLTQNIWLIIGPKGEISEVKASALYEGEEKCPPLAQDREHVRFGALSLGMHLNDKTLKSEDFPAPSLVSESTPWNFWFATNRFDSHLIRYGFVGAKITPPWGITQMFSTELLFKD